MEITTIRLALCELPDQFDQTRPLATRDVLARVLAEVTGKEIEVFVDSACISISVPASSLYAAVVALRDMRIV